MDSEMSEINESDDGYKTPLPKPDFSSYSASYSTKKDRLNPRRIGPPPLTAPAGLYSKRYVAQKPHRISFKLEEIRLSFALYDERKHESYFDQCFTVESKIGEGSFGQVFKVRSKEDNNLYAVKKAMEPFRGESDRAKRLSEVHKHELLPRHPNLLRFIEAWEERGRLYIRTELCKISLTELCESVHDIPEPLIWRFLVDLLLAVKHLHDHDLIHMDIKPDNILISEDGICKLGDFGLVCDLKKDALDDFREGDSKYLAPEVLDNRIGKHVDIFSLGITILEISADLDLPSSGDTWKMLRRGQIPVEFLNGKSNELIDVIRLMLIPDDVQRPSAADILSLPSVLDVWRWRRKYVAHSQIRNLVQSCLIIFWTYFSIFGRDSSKAKSFLRFHKRRTQPIPPAARHFDDSTSMDCEGSAYFDDDIANGNITKELKLDSSSDVFPLRIFGRTMQEPGSPLVPLDPSRFREMVEKQTQQQTPSTPVVQSQQHPLANQYYRENLTRTQSTSSVGSAESSTSAAASVAGPPRPVSTTTTMGEQQSGHFQQQMSPQYSPHIAPGQAGQQQRFWYPHAHSSPRSSAYPQQPPSVQPPGGQIQQPMTPQPVRTPQSVGSANSPRMSMPPAHTPGSQVMSPDMAQSSPGSARSPMGSPIQPQPSPMAMQQTRIRVAMPHPNQPMVYQQPPPQGYPPNYQQQQPPGAFSPNYAIQSPQQAYPRQYGGPPRPGSIIMQQQPPVSMQQQMVAIGRPVMIRQPQYMQRPPGMPMSHPMAVAGQLPPGAYPDQGVYVRAQQHPQQFVQYGVPQQHPISIQPSPGQYGKPAGFSPGGGQIIYGAPDGSMPPGFVSQQRYPMMQQQAGQPPGMMSPPIVQRMPPSNAPMTPTYAQPPTMQQSYQRAMPPQQYVTGGVALNPQQAAVAGGSSGNLVVSPVGPGSQLQPNAVVFQQQQQSGQAPPLSAHPQQASIRFQQPYGGGHQQIRSGPPPPTQLPPHLQQQPIDIAQQQQQQIRPHQVAFALGSPQQQQQQSNQQLQSRMVHPGGIAAGQLMQQQQQALPQHVPPEMKMQFFGHEPHVTVPADMCLVGGVFLIVDYDRILDQKEVGDWRLVITMHGGEVETSYSAKCTHLICESLRHPVVQQALKEGKRCVTAQWLNDCLLQKRLQPPWKAVHFPSQYGDNKPCKNKFFTVCGFDVNERSCLKQMITAVGGRYTPYLSKHNAFLVAKWYAVDDLKVAKAIEWKIQIVNVQFLTELFLGQGAVLQNITNPKYHQFLPRELLQQQHPNAIDPFRIDPVIMPALMGAWRIPITFTNECWKNALERKQKIENDDGKIFPHKKLKLSPAPEDSEIENHRRSLNLRGAAFPRICFTGLYPAEMDNLTRKALWLGGEIVNDVKNCTHLIASDLKRTQKLLHGIALGKFVVTPLWIRQSYKQQQFVDALEYLVKDEGNEKFFGFNLKLTIHRARQAKLFQNVAFYLTPSVQPYLSVLRELIQTAGGAILQQRPPSKRILELQQQGVQLVVITCENDLHLCQSLLESGIAVHSAEFVLTGILRQEVDFTSYKLEPRQTDASKSGRDA